MEAGYAPFVPTEFQISASDAGSRFHMLHEIEIERGGAVYDLSNIKIVDPSTHHAISYRTSKPMPEATMVEHSGQDQLISLVEVVCSPKGTGVSSEGVTLMLFRFCANCPDPVGAMRLMEDMTPRTAEQLVDFALSMSARDPRAMSASELPLGHPLRRIGLDG